MSFLRPLIGLVLLALLGCFFYIWRRSTEKELPGDPTALVISLSVTPAPEIRQPTPEPDKTATPDAASGSDGANSSPPAAPDATPVTDSDKVAAADAKPQVIVHFENRSSQPVKILKPLVGSERELDLPFYSLTVNSQLGTEVPMIPNGTSAEAPTAMKWPDDYILEIQPGKSVDVPLQLLRILPLPGRYRFRFNYSFDPTNAGKSGNANHMIYPKGLWIGSVSSEPFSADLTGWYALQSKK